nr:response regulator [Clostridium tetanomorphum]
MEGIFVEIYNEIYKHLFNISDSIILILSPEGKILYANENAIKCYGYSYDELLNMNIHELRNKKIKSVVKRQIIRAMKDEVVFFQTSHFRKDGTKFPVEVKSKFINLGCEEVLLSIIRDISDKKEVAEALKEKCYELKKANIKITFLENELRKKNNELYKLKNIINNVEKHKNYIENCNCDANTIFSKKVDKLKNFSNVVVLVVEDNEISKQIAISFLNKKGYRTICASNGKIALDIIEKNKVDVILMDLEMPILDGYETVKIIREKERSGFKHIPIIAMTAYSQDKDKEKCINAGMEDHISKPFSSGELYCKIQKYLPKE